jgi:hypothetical protein
VLVVDRLAGVLFEMQALDADLHVLELAFAIRPDRDGDLSLADDRLLELRDLIALRKIRIKIVLPVENRLVVDLGLQAEAGADRLAHAFFVDHGQHAGHGRVDQADIGVGRRAEGSRCAGKQLRLRGHLGVDFEADDDFPVAGRSGNEALGVGRAGIDDGHGGLICCAVRFSLVQTARSGKGGVTGARRRRLALPFGSLADDPSFFEFGKRSRRRHDVSGLSA